MEGEATDPQGADSAPEQVQLPHATLAGLNRCGWEDVLAEVNSPKCRPHWQGFRDLATKHLEVGDMEAAAAAHVLNAVGMFHVRDASAVHCFGQPIPIADEDVAALAEWYPQLTHAGLRARVADLVWQRDRSNKAAWEAALEACLEAEGALFAAGLGLEGWKYVERAFALAKFGRDTDRQKQSLARADERMADPGPDPSPGFIGSMSRWRVQHYVKDYAALVEQLERHIGHFRAAKNEMMVQELSTILARAHALAGNQDAALAARVQQAESLVADADAQRNAGNEAYFLMKAIQCYLQIGGHGERVKELRHRLESVQPLMLREMHVFEQDMDLGDAPYKQALGLSGRDLRGALMGLIASNMMESLDDVRSRAEEILEKHPLRKLFPATHVDGRGRTVGVSNRKPLSEMDPDEPLMQEISQQYAMEASLKMQAFVATSREMIAARIQASPHDLWELIAESPLIPPGRGELWLLGLWNGFEGNYVTASHILVPQIEHMIREQLRAMGENVRELKRDGIEHEKQLGGLLANSRLEGVYGQTGTFLLRWFFVDYVNFRNDISHGMVEVDRFQGWEPIFVWWLALSIALTHQLHMSNGGGEDSASAGLQGGEEE